MRKLLVLFVIAVAPISMAHARSFEPQTVTVEQLRQTLATLHGKSDKKVAKQLAELELTERLSRAEFEVISKTLPGAKSRTALLALEDVSMFLDPPPSEMVPDPAPDAEAQKQMLMHAGQLANDQADSIPNFVAMRSAEHFQDVRVYPYSNKIEYYTPGSFRLIEHQVNDISCSAGGDDVLDQPDKDLDRSMARQRQPLMYMTIFGYQTIWGNITWNLPNLTQAGMKPTGAFGPWLQAVTGDAPDGKAEWAYWERSGSGKLAVYRFHIAPENSHYTIHYDFAANPILGQVGHAYTAAPGYHGEIAIDPETGQVARIVVICDFAKGEPMSRASMELEYAMQRVGGEEYLLPVRGVSISSFSLATHNLLFDNGDSIGEQSDHFPVTSVDDLAFSNYRVFKPRIRILPLKSLDRPAK
ncbi:MAG: hypothetical protein ACLGSD_04875 [Acidobacteriota bacterium]